MTIYKEAQAINFQNQDLLYKQLGRLKKESEFNMYISILTQIHEAMKGKDADTLEEVVNQTAGSSGFKQTMNIIDGVGRQIFISSVSSAITSSLRDAWSQLNQPEPVAAQPGEIPGVKNEEFGSQFESAYDLLYLSAEERYEYFTGLDYPSAFRNQASVIIRNMKEMEYVIAHPNSSKIEIQRAQSDLLNAMEELIKIAEGEMEVIDSDEVDFDQEKEVVEKDISSRSGPQREGQPQFNPFKGEANSSSTSKKTKKEVVDHSILDHPNIKEFYQRSKNPYIDFSQDPPVFNDSMESVFMSLSSGISNIYKRAIGGESRDGLKRELNDLIYAVKVSDTDTFEQIQEYKKLLGEDAAKEFEYIESRFIGECPSARVLDDIYQDENENSIKYLLFSASLLLGSPKVADVVIKTNTRGIANESTEKTVINETHYDAILESMRKLSENKFNSATNSFFRLSSRYGMNNFIARVAVLWSTVMGGALKEVIPSGPKYTLKPCPTCFKEIPWTATKDAKKQQESFVGFEIPMVSPYTSLSKNLGENEQVTMVTEEILNSYDGFPPPPAREYGRNREKKLIQKYISEGSKSWQEIKALLNSNNPEEHEEGWHRRAGAFLAIGCEKLNTGKAVRIKNQFVECPFDPKVVEGSGSLCGLAASPAQAQTLDGSLSSRVALQPQWNGTKHDYKNFGQNNQSGFDESAWEDPTIAEQVKRMQSGGFKFSKTNFACTAHIDQLNGMSSYKHGHIAISKVGPAGSAGFSYPTKKDGSLDLTLQDGTLTFMVCGAPTSLSSFDRSTSSSGFILEYLKKIRQNSETDFVKLMEILISNGIDVEDAMALHSDLERWNANPEDEVLKESSVKNRLDRLHRFMKESALKMYDDDKTGELRRLLGGLNLTCPFGHTFNIEHSLQFGEAYAGIFSKETTSPGFSSFITSKGRDNLVNLVKAKKLVPIDHDEVSEFETMPYEDWKNIDARRRTVFPNLKNPEKIVLAIPIPEDIQGEDRLYCFVPMQGKMNIWNPNSSYETSNATGSSLEKIEGEKDAVSLDSTFDDGTTASKADFASKAQWELEKMNDLISIDSYRKPTIAIPGTEIYSGQLAEGQTEQGILNQKILHFSRAIKSSLRIIDTWTRGSVTNSMLSAMFVDYEPNFSPFAPHISYLVSNSLEISDAQTGEDINDMALVSKISGLASGIIIKSLNNVVGDLYSWIRSNVQELTDEGFSQRVAAIVIKSALEDAENNGFLKFMNPEESFKNQFLESGSGFEVMFKGGAIEQLSSTMIKGNPAFLNEILLNTDKANVFQKEKAESQGRIALVSYARQLATILSNIYKKYSADESSNLYIGYNIGIDLSNPDIILGFENNGEWVGGITVDMIGSIVDSYEKAEAATGGKIGEVFQRRMQVSSGELTYSERIDRAWEELNGYLANARKEVFSARGCELAKEYVVSRMSHISDAEVGAIRERMESFQPVRSIRFSDTVENPEMGTNLFIKQRIPFVSKSLPFVKALERVEEWVLRDKTGGNNYSFPTEGEAKQFLDGMLSKDSEDASKYELIPAPYYVDEKTGFNSSKIQVGVCRPKNDAKDAKWPPKAGMWDFAGIVLPFNDPGFESQTRMSMGSKVQVPFYKMEIEFEGSPLDITPLIRKGDKDSIKKLYAAEKLIVEAQAEHSAEVGRFKRQNARAIDNDATILDNFVSGKENELSLKLRPLLKTIDSIPVAIGTDSVFTEPKTPKNGKKYSATTEGRKMLRLSIEDPMRAYQIIKNPGLRGVNIDDDEAKRLLSFVIQVYNIDMLADIARTHVPKYENIIPEQFFDVAEKGGSIPIGKYMSTKKAVWTDRDGEDRVSWGHSPGRYFDVIPGEEKADSGSYFQYVYSMSNRSQASKVQRNIPSLRQLLSAGRTMTRSGIPDKEDSDAAGFAQKIEEDMLEYISSRTSGARSNPAKDRRKEKKASSEYTSKISLRRSDLDRMILSLGTFDFSDVEMPDF